ncbi:hypothetical protein GCM10027176_46770 [Actinoallomurus bryophytorum]|uniref:hypothetical protein n=1 Tax=Actinoallomurus bryophytorum TaxID=1490222 RepID=UPI00114DF1DA|nr:hypothetical protein [Actinoallomurus bryophytorum]
MTNTSAFGRAWLAFRAMPYPDYPLLEELKDWNSELLTIDGDIAGWASRVYSRDISPREISDLDEIIVKVDELRRSLNFVHPKTTQDVQLVGEYRTYVEALFLVVEELKRLAR